MIASSDFADFEDTPTDRSLSTDNLDRIAAYFAAHLGLRQGALDLALTVVGASVRVGEHADVGHYKLLVVQMTTSLHPGEDVFPLALTYDAVMHEVRNHRATVYWTQPDKSPSRLASFGFAAADGSSQPVLLLSP